MLTELNVRNALESAKQLKDKGLNFICAEGSPLKELVEASLPITEADLSTQSVNPLTSIKKNTIDNFVYENDDRFVDAVLGASKGYGEETAHTLRVRALADEIAPFVVGHIAFARNTVVPLISEAEEAFTQFLSMATQPSASSAFQIVKGSLPELVFDDAFIASGLENFNGPDAFTGFESLSYKADFVMPEDIDGFVSAVKNQGSDRLNGLVDRWLVTAAPDLIKRVFLVNFTKSGDGLVESDMKAEPGYVAGTPLDIFAQYGFNNFGSNGSNAFDAIHTALAYYLIATYLASNPGKTTVSLDLVAYKNMLEEARIVSGTIVNRLVKRIRIQHESNVLVSEYNALQKKIVVNADIYAAWLEQGGSPEVLLGFLVSNQGILDANTALEAKDKGLRSWEIYVALKDSDAQENIKASFRSYIHSYMLTRLAELTSFEKDYCSAEKPHRERVMALVEAYIQAHALTITQDVGHLALHLVAQCRFYFTSAFTLLEEMRQVSLKNPDIDPREAAGMATISYITEYLAAQIGNSTQA